MPPIRLTFLLAVILVGFCPIPGLAQDYFFDGDAGPDEVGSYLLLDFDVPDGTTRIDVAYSYENAGDGSGGTSSPLAGLLDDVIDIGLYDPDGFRGWSGSNKSAFSVALSAEATTPSYVPGPIPVGAWQVELGVGWVNPGHMLHYAVTVSLSSDDVGPTFEPPYLVPIVLSGERRWYKGDLHCHSEHSDGAPMADVFEYAHSRGLDFVALTDHNTVSHTLFIPEYQDLYPDMLLLYGIEVTTYRGHANALGVASYVDYHGTAPGYDVNAVIDRVHALGGLFSPNHPNQPVIPLHGSYYGWGWGFPETDWSRVDSLEAINGPSRIAGTIPNPLNTLAIRRWDGLQDEGFRVPLRGGSDDHQAGQGSGPTYSPIGSPTTVVYADELSAAGIYDGLRAGRAFVMTEGPDGPEVYLSAASDDRSAIVGETIGGDDVRVSARVLRGAGMRLVVLRDGEAWRQVEDLPSDDEVVEISEPIEAPCRVRAEVYDGSILKVITNSIFVETGADDDTGDDDTSGDDADDDGSADANDAGRSESGCGC